jgi:hypothetical protein
VFVDISWGTPQSATGPYGGSSGLALSRVDDGTVEDNSAPVVLGTLTHFNRPITGTNLESTQMQWTLALFDNATDAANAEGSGNANAVYEQTGNFTIYNWETTNAGYDPGGFRYFNGSAWVSNGDTRCPNFFAAGTPVTPTTSGTPTEADIFLSNGNPTGATECGDAHIYLPKTLGASSFEYDGETYQIVLSGFYAEEALGGALIDTFWACEQEECNGTVKFAVTGPRRFVQVPVMPGAVLLLTGLLLGGGAWRKLKSRA